MFDKIAGLPAHPLLVHGAVVMIPLLIVVGIAFALVPAIRHRIDWAAGLLAVAAPASAFTAVESGESLQRTLSGKGLSGDLLAQINTHQWYADRALWSAGGLGVATLLLVLLSARRRSVPGWLLLALSAAVVVLGAVAGFYVFKTGDTGAAAVWSGV